MVVVVGGGGGSNRDNIKKTDDTKSLVERVTGRKYKCTSHGAKLVNRRS